MVGAQRKFLWGSARRSEITFHGDVTRGGVLENRLPDPEARLQERRAQTCSAGNGTRRAFADRDVNTAEKAEPIPEPDYRHLREGIFQRKGRGAVLARAIDLDRCQARYPGSRERRRHPVFLPIRSGFHFHESSTVGFGQVTLLREDTRIDECLELFFAGHAIQALFEALPCSFHIRFRGGRTHLFLRLHTLEIGLK